MFKLSGHAILIGLGVFSVELRWLGRVGYKHRGWGDKWGAFMGTYYKGMRFYAIGPLMITFEGYNGYPYVRVF